MVKEIELFMLQNLICLFAQRSSIAWIYVRGRKKNHTLTFLYFHSSQANIVIMSFELFCKCTKVYFKNNAFKKNNNNGVWRTD